MFQFMHRINAKVTSLPILWSNNLLVLYSRNYAYTWVLDCTQILKHKYIRGFVELEFFNISKQGISNVVTRWLGLT